MALQYAISNYQSIKLIEMKKKILVMSLMACAFVSCMSAQSTARKFVVKNSADGQSEITCYLPQNPTGRAVLDCPGGGYGHLAMNHEGYDWAEYFNKQGIAFFILKYRIRLNSHTFVIKKVLIMMRCCYVPRCDKNSMTVKIENKTSTRKLR